MRFHFPIIIIDEDFRSENTSGLGIRALAKAIEEEGMEVLGVTSYGDLTSFAQQQSRGSTFILSIDDEEFSSPEASAKAIADLRAFVEEIRFRSADGTEIEGLLLKPLDAVPGRRHPTILRLHGGPVYQFSREFMADWQAYAAAGFAVLAVNPRGSSGRGFEFAKAIYADWGNRDVQDVLAGVDHAVALGVADPERLGVGGWSYGGILTNYVIAADARFQAAVSGAGATNTFASYGFDQYTREYEAELGTPWDNPDAYARVSRPFLQAGRIATPTLFQCAERDFNVPCLGAMQMYQALRSREVPTQLVVYPGQYHGLDVPSYLVDRLQRNIDWYSRYLMPRK